MIPRIYDDDDDDDDDYDDDDDDSDTESTSSGEIMIMQHAQDMRKIKMEADGDSDLGLEERAQVTRNIAFNTTAFASEADKIEKDKTEVTVNINRR